MNNKKCSRNSDFTALVVEGGAMRGIFSTGVLDAFLTKNFNPFDIAIGVSAGATNIAAYLAEMYKRNFRVYTEYSVGPDFINWKKFMMGGHLVDLDWLWDITIREVKLDIVKILSSGSKYYVGVTEINTGNAVYLKPEKHNLEELIKASSSIPVFYRNPVIIEGMEYVDGGLADPIPVIEAYRRGAKNIMVLRSRPYTYNMKSSSKNLLSKLYLRKHPKLVEASINRANRYKEAIDFMRNPPEGIKIFEVNPPEDFQTKRLTKNVSILVKDYNYGHDIGMKIMKEWDNFIR
jgi:predicted patatin/cPLA2 family phospholipase